MPAEKKEFESRGVELSTLCRQLKLRSSDGKYYSTDYVWVDFDEVKNYDCIKGVPEEISKAIALFSKD